MCEWEQGRKAHLFLILVCLRRPRRVPSAKMENPVKMPQGLAFKVSLGGLSYWQSNQIHPVLLDICLSSGELAYSDSPNLSLRKHRMLTWDKNTKQRERDFSFVATFALYSLIALCLLCCMFLFVTGTCRQFLVIGSSDRCLIKGLKIKL